jgi:hypothetical protein
MGGQGATEGDIEQRAANEKHYLQRRLHFSEIDARRAGWGQVGMAL